MYNNYGLTQAPVVNEPTGFEQLFNSSEPVLVVFGLFLVLAAIAFAILVIVAQCKIFKKAGEAQWKALIPVYSTWVNTKIAGLAWWWFLIIIALTTVVGTWTNVNWVFTWGVCLVSFNYSYNLAKKFGKTNGFAFLMTILPIIGIPILGFGSDKYDKGAKVDKNGIFKVEK